MVIYAAAFLIGFSFGALLLNKGEPSNTDTANYRIERIVLDVDEDRETIDASKDKKTPSLEGKQ